MSFGYRGKIYNHNDKLEGDVLECHYARCAREPLNFREECIETARLISQQAASMGRKPVLMLSGGMDSQVVALACLNAGIDFSAITYRFADGLNAHDTGSVHGFVQLNQISHSFYDIDVHQWMKSDEAALLFDSSKATTFAALPHMKLMQHIWDTGGMPVMGNGDLYLENTATGWQYTELEHMLAWCRFAIDSGINCCTGFFQHTPEIVLSAVRHPVFQRLGSGANRSANALFQNSRYVKCQMYQQIWPELESRQKFHGAELIRQLVKQMTPRALPTVSFDDKVQIPFREFEQLLQGTISPVPHS